jgi:hypothetical protein
VISPVAGEILPTLGSVAQVLIMGFNPVILQANLGLEDKMKLASRIVAVVTFFATYVPLGLSGGGIDMWGLAWQWWAMIGFTIFSASVGFIIWELYSRIKVLESEDTRLTREERKLNIKNGLFDFWQKTLSDTPISDELKKKLDSLD